MKKFFARLLGGKPSPIGWQGTAERIGDYSVVRKLGSGGTSDVFLGVHVDSMATAAIKQLSLKRSAAAHRQMFQTESLLCGKLDHPNIVGLYGASFADPAHIHLVMEYVDGCALDCHEAAGGLLAPAKVVEVMRQAAEGLRYLAQEGVIHRDLKPGNLLLRRDGRVKIADFGCAILPGRQQEALRVAGSLPYMSPEQIRAEALDHRADMYSLGAVFYRLLTGQVPIAAREDEEAPSYARRILETQPAPLLQQRPDVSAALAAVIERMLRKEAAARYASWDDFLHALHRASSPQQAVDEEWRARWQSFELQRAQLLGRDRELSFGM